MQPYSEIWSINKHSKRIIFLQKKNAEGEAGRLVSDLFLFFKKSLFKVKAKGLQFSFNIFR